MSVSCLERIPAIRRGNLVVDPQSYTVTLNKKEIRLYPKEFDVLYLLAQYPDWVLSASQIYEAVWKEELAGCEHVIYNVIYQLRKKLGDSSIVETVKDHGYRLVE